MPRRSSRRRSTIGKTDGMPTEPRYSSGNIGGGNSRGPRVQISEHSTPVDTLKMVDGGQLVTFPTYDPLFTSRAAILHIDGQVFQLKTFCSNNNVNNHAFLTAISNDQTIVAQGLIDNIARAYANAQNLELTAASDLSGYCSNFMAAYTIYATLSAILNGDGFNDRMQQLATIGITSRSRIQTGWDRLQTLPIPPGIVDVCRRISGAFASYVGGPVILSSVSNTTVNGVPVDLTTTAGWTAMLTAAEGALTNCLTNAEAGVVRIILAEYFGNPIPLPISDGVKVGDSLFLEKLLTPAHSLMTTNVFAAPYVVTGGTTVVPGQLVPLLVPRGQENDVLWASLWRQPFFDLYNNVVKASAAGCGIFQYDQGQNSGLRWYGIGATTSNADSDTTPPFNGYSDVMNDFIFWPYTGNSEAVGYASDDRMHRDFISFPVSVDVLANNTALISRKIFLEKARYPLPSDISIWTTERVINRSF